MKGELLISYLGCFHALNRIRMLFVSLFRLAKKNKFRYLFKLYRFVLQFRLERFSRDPSYVSKHEQSIVIYRSLVQVGLHS